MRRADRRGLLYDVRHKIGRVKRQLLDGRVRFDPAFRAIRMSASGRTRSAALAEHDREGAMTCVAAFARDFDNLLAARQPFQGGQQTRLLAPFTET